MILSIALKLFYTVSEIPPVVSAILKVLLAVQETIADPYKLIENLLLVTFTVSTIGII